MRDWLQLALWFILGLPLALIMLYLLARSFDPPWNVTETRGTILSWGATVDPEVIVHYYKMQLFVRTDDGRTIGVYSTRRIPREPAIEWSSRSASACGHRA